MTYEEMFSEIKAKFAGADVSDYKGHLAVEFNVTGDGSGIFYAEIKDGKLFIEPYNYYDRDVRLTADFDVFSKVLSGETSPVAAYTTGKLKVDGSIEKALELTKIIESAKKAEKAAAKAAAKAEKAEAKAAAKAEKAEAKAAAKADKADTKTAAKAETPETKTAAKADKAETKTAEKPAAKKKTK